MKKRILIIAGVFAVVLASVLTIAVSAKNTRKTVTVQCTPGPDGEADVIQYDVYDLPFDPDDPETWYDHFYITPVYDRGTKVIKDEGVNIFMAFSTYPTELDNYAMGSPHHAITFVLDGIDYEIRSAAVSDNITKGISYVSGTVQRFTVTLPKPGQKNVFEVYRGGNKVGAIEITFEKGQGPSGEEFIIINSVASTDLKVSKANYDYANRLFFS